MTHCGGYDATPESLLAAGISCAGAAYRDWIASIVAARNIGTIRVKLADHEDNQDSVRVTMIPGADRVVETGYVPAQAILLARLSRNRARSGAVTYEA